LGSEIEKEKQMSTWKKITVYVVKADGKFIDQVHTKERAEQIAAKHKAKGCKVTIKKSIAETMAVSFGVI
jgi:hypothetical protein